MAMTNATGEYAAMTRTNMLSIMARALEVAPPPRLQAEEQHLLAEEHPAQHRVHAPE